MPSYRLLYYLNSIQDGPFRGCSRMGVGQKAPLPKIFHTYPTMMKLGIIIPYLKKTQRINELYWVELSCTDISNPWVVLTSVFFHRESANRLHFGTKCLILLTFFESSKKFLINMVTILMMSAKLAPPRLLK